MIIILKPSKFLDIQINYTRFSGFSLETEHLSLSLHFESSWTFSQRHDVIQRRTNRGSRGEQGSQMHFLTGKLCDRDTPESPHLHARHTPLYDWHLHFTPY